MQDTLAGGVRSKEARNAPPNTYNETMSINLTPSEARVLGVLVEKAQTTPAQYPMTLNGITTGCNQKSNRFPLLKMSEDDVLGDLDTLRGKGLVREVMMTGSRVPKFKHNAREALDVTTSELVVLTELMLRGPQTLGEIRGRASRMHPLESLDVVRNVLQSLNDREHPLAKNVGPAAGSRADRYAQLLAPNAHRLDEAPSVGSSGASAPAASAPSSIVSPDIEQRLAALESEVAALREEIDVMRKKVGSTMHRGVD